MVKIFWQILGWSISCTISIICSIFIVLYAVTFGPQKTISWLIAFLVSIMKKIFLTEMATVICIAITLSLWYRRPPQDRIDHDKLTARRLSDSEILKVRLDQLMHRFLTRKFGRGKEDDIKRERGSIRYNNIIRDSLMVAFYIIALQLIVLCTRDKLAYYSRRNVDEIINSGKYSVRGFTARDVSDTVSLYIFINETLVETVNNGKYYNGNPIEGGNGWLNDKMCKILGVIRLRQHRIRPGDCPENIFNSNCVGYFHPDNADTADYGLAWGKVKKKFPYEKELWRLIKIWRYQNSTSTESLPMYGERYVYSGGGYVAQLGRTYENSQHVLRYLMENNWLDRRTMTVFIEFTLYNLNANIFNVVTIIAEKSAQGLYHITYSIKTTKFLLATATFSAISALGFFCLLTICLLYYVITSYRCRKIISFTDKIYATFDTIMVSLSITCIAVYIRRDRYVRGLLLDLKTMRQNEFHSFAYACAWDELFSWLSAILTTLATIRLWKALQFAKVFRVLANTLKASWKSLAAALSFFLILLTGLSIAVHTVNGSHSGPFNKGINTLTCLLAFSFGFQGEIDPRSLFHGGKFMGFMIYGTEMIAISILFTNMFITIICYHFREIKTESELALEKDYTLQEYLKDSYGTYHQQPKKHTDHESSESLRLRGGGGKSSKKEKSKYKPVKSYREKISELNANKGQQYTEEKTNLAMEIIDAQFDLLEKHIDHLKSDITDAENTSGETSRNVKKKEGKVPAEKNHTVLKNEENEKLDYVTKKSVALKKSYSSTRTA